MRKVIFGAISMLALSTAAFAEDGAAIYKSTCQACHGVDGKGTAMAPAFAGMHHLSTCSDRQIADVILKGRSGAEKMHNNFTAEMPPQKLTADELKAVVDYVKSLAGK